LAAKTSLRNPGRNGDGRDANAQSVKRKVLRVLGPIPVLRAVIRRNCGGRTLMIEKGAVLVIGDDQQALTILEHEDKDMFYVGHDERSLSIVR
jgi:hypothetical protein